MITKEQIVDYLTKACSPYESFIVRTRKKYFPRIGVIIFCYWKGKKCSIGRSFDFNELSYVPLDCVKRELDFKLAHLRQMYYLEV